MRVLVLSQYYKPEPIPKPGDLAEELTRRGHDVRVITGFPNYPSGSTYPGTSIRPVKRESVDGVPVTRFFEIPHKRQSVVGRILNYWSFAVSVSLGSLMLRWRPDVIYVWHPPLTVGVAAWFIARMYRVPFVYDVQDIWPDSGVYSGLLKEGRFVRLMRRLESFVYRRADALVSVTEAAAKELVARGARSDRVVNLLNWAGEGLSGNVPAEMVRKLRADMDLDGRFVLVYAGNLGLVQGLDILVRCAGHLESDRYRILFVGDGTDRSRLESLSEELGVASVVRFIGRQPIEQMPLFHAVADALVVHLRESRLSDWVIPSKLIGYLAAGRPIVAGLDGAGAELVEASGAGVVVRPGNPEGMAAAVRHLASSDADELKEMGRAGRAYFEEFFDKSNLIDQYESLLQRVANRRVVR